MPRGLVEGVYALVVMRVVRDSKKDQNSGPEFVGREKTRPAGKGRRKGEAPPFVGCEGDPTSELVACRASFGPFWPHRRRRSLFPGWGCFLVAGRLSRSAWPYPYMRLSSPGLTSRFTVVDPQDGIQHARRSPGRLGY